MKTIVVTQLLEQDGRAYTKSRRISTEFIKSNYLAFMPSHLKESVGAGKYSNLTELKLERDGRTDVIFVLETPQQIEQKIQEKRSDSLLLG